MEFQSTLGSPRCRTFLVVPTVFSQPKISSTRFLRALAHLVGEMPGRAAIEGAVADLVGHVRRHIMLPQLLHEGRHAISAAC